MLPIAIARGLVQWVLPSPIWLFFKIGDPLTSPEPLAKSRGFSPSKLIQNAGWDKSLLSLYKSKLEVTTTRNLKIWYQGLDDTCWWTTIINQQSTSFPKWWFQILSWNHQLEPLTTFRTRTVGLATSLSSCFYTIRLEWHLDDWGKSCHSFWFRIWCVCFSSKHSVCILCGIYTVYISVYKYTYIHVYVCKSTMHPYTGIPIHKYV